MGTAQTGGEAGDLEVLLRENNPEGKERGVYGFEMAKILPYCDDEDFRAEMADVCRKSDTWIAADSIKTTSFTTTQIKEKMEEGMRKRSVVEVEKRLSLARKREFLEARGWDEHLWDNAQLPPHLQVREQKLEHVLDLDKPNKASNKDSNKDLSKDSKKGSTKGSTKGPTKSSKEDLGGSSRAYVDPNTPSKVYIAVTILKAKNLPGCDIDGSIDPYCKIYLGADPSEQCLENVANVSKDIKRVSGECSVVVRRCHNPMWNATFYFELSRNTHPYITIQIWDKDSFSADDLVGSIIIPAVDAISMTKDGCVLNMEGKRSTIETMEGKRSAIENMEAKQSGIENMEGKCSVIENKEGKRSGIENMESKRSGIEKMEGKRSGIEKMEGKWYDIERVVDSVVKKGLDLGSVLVRVCCVDPMGIMRKHREKLREDFESFRHLANPHLYLNPYIAFSESTEGLERKKSSEPTEGVEPKRNSEPRTKGNHPEPMGNVEGNKLLGLRGGEQISEPDTKRSEYKKMQPSESEPRSEPRLLPAGALETPEMAISDVTLSVSGKPIMSGRLMVTNFRLVFNPQKRSEDWGADRGIYSFNGSEWVGKVVSIPLQLIMSVTVDSGESSERGGTSTKQNKLGKVRWFMISVECFDFRIVEFLVITLSVEELSKLSAFVTKLQIPVTSRKDLSHKIAMLMGVDVKVPYDRRIFFDMSKEIKRQGVNVEWWRASKMNEDYGLCESYPKTLYVPKTTSDEILQESAKFRSKCRLPVLTWIDGESGVSLCRCAQPRVGLGNSFSVFDEQHVRNIRKARRHGRFNENLESSDESKCRPRGDDRLVIIDCRSKIAADANSFKGKGTENIKRYQHCKLSFQDIGNIHSIRGSLHLFRAAINSTSDDADWMLKVHRSGWMRHISQILTAASRVVYHIKHRKSSVLVHCSDGWDRTSQVCGLAEVMLDPYYRTIQGLIVLIEKDWFAFGHKFKDRLDFGESSQEVSPVFLQFLDCLWQIYHQFPESFEYDGSLLRDLVIFSQIGWFAEFQVNTDKSRQQHTGASVWGIIYANIDKYKNRGYDAKKNSKVLLISSSIKAIRIWPRLYLQYDESFIGNLRFQNCDGKGGVLSHRPYKSASRMQSRTHLDANGPTSIVMWEPDEWSADCNDCNEPFTWFRRRHHCRACGRVFCNNCSRQRAKLPHLGMYEPVRVCERCADRMMTSSSRALYRSNPHSFVKEHIKRRNRQGGGTSERGGTGTLSLHMESKNRDRMSEGGMVVRRSVVIESGPESTICSTWF
ncbi:hypothetical protein AAMO2058_000877700 [Amorphochlora amoebiformis]